MRKPVVGRWRLVVGQVLLAMGLCFCSGAARAQSKTVVLKGGKLLTVSHGVIDNGVLVMSGGKIAAIGAAGSVKIPQDAEIVDVTGMTVYPGLIDSETYLGLTEISAEISTTDLIESSDEMQPTDAPMTPIQRPKPPPDQTEKAATSWTTPITRTIQPQVFRSVITPNDRRRT